MLSACIPPPPGTAGPAPPDGCRASAGRPYDHGFATRYDPDDPVRPAAHHADKNLGLRSYAPVTDPAVRPELVDYGRDDPTQPPQLATLFDPPRVAEFAGLYVVHDWRWSPAPDPGMRGAPLAQFPVTALGLRTAPGEAVHVPASGYDLGSRMEVLVLYADADSVTLRYAREDSSGAPGYTVFVDGLCTDPGLMRLYRRLDDPGGPRYDPAVSMYDLPVLPAGGSFATARGSEIVVAISDTGTFLDPRSWHEWWTLP